MWTQDFIYAKSLKTTKSASQLPRYADCSESWLTKELSKLGNVDGQETLFKKIRGAGRTLDKGYISTAAYDKYMRALVEKQMPSPKKRPQSAPIVGRRLGDVPERASSGRVPMKKKVEPTPWQTKAKVRSQRERQRTMAWVEKTALGDQDETEEGRRQVVAMAKTTPVAVRESLSAFGTVLRVEPKGPNKFLVTFAREHSARKALNEGAWLKNAVKVAPLPRDCDRATLRRILSRWGRVIAVKLDTESAVVYFEAESSAKFAVGDRKIEATNEVHVDIPSDATEDHVRRAFGGKRNGVTRVKILTNRKKAVVVFESPAQAQRALGPRELCVTRPGGALDALEKSQAAARKGAKPPWHCAIERPFADCEIHTFPFGHSPANPDEYTRRAAGTFHPRQSNKVPGAGARFATRRVQILATKPSTVLKIRHCPFPLQLAKGP